MHKEEDSTLESRLTRIASDMVGQLADGPLRLTDSAQKRPVVSKPELVFSDLAPNAPGPRSHLSGGRCIVPFPAWVDCHLSALAKAWVNFSPSP